MAKKRQRTMTIRVPQSQWRDVLIITKWLVENTTCFESEEQAQWWAYGVVTNKDYDRITPSPCSKFGYAFVIPPVVTLENSTQGVA